MNAILVTFLVTVNLRLVFGTCPTIISKQRWGARAANQIEYAIRPVKYVIIHHTSTSTCSDEDDCSTKLVNMQSYHMNQRDFDDIGYNFIIGGDGQIYEGVGWHKVGAHTLGYNRKSVGIAYMGDFQTKAPSAKQLQAGKDLIQCGVNLGEIDLRYKLLGARSLRPTDSPGTILFREIQNWRGFSRAP